MNTTTGIGSPNGPTVAAVAKPDLFPFISMATKKPIDWPATLAAKASARQIGKTKMTGFGMDPMQTTFSWPRCAWTNASGVDQQKICRPLIPEGN